MLKRTALVDDEQRWQATTVRATWVVEHLVAGNKAQSLFAAVDGLVYKRSEVQI